MAHCLSREGINLDSDISPEEIGRSILEMKYGIAQLREASAIWGEHNERVGSLLQREIAALRREQQESEGRIEFAFRLCQSATVQTNSNGSHEEIAKIHAELKQWRLWLLAAAAILSGIAHGLAWVFEPFYRFFVEKLIHRSLGE